MGVPDIKSGSAQNTTSRARAALRAVGVDVPDGIGRNRLPQAWVDALERLPERLAADLNVFAHWCAEHQVLPSGVDDRLLDRLELDLQVNRAAHGARQYYLKVANAWPIAVEILTQAGLTNAQPTRPRARRQNQFGAHYQLPLPHAFEDELSDWQNYAQRPRQGNPDRPRQIGLIAAKNEVQTLRRIASAYCHQSGRAPETIVRIADLVSVDVLDAVIAFLSDRRKSNGRAGVRNQDHAYITARVLAKAATYWTRAPLSVQHALERKAHALAPKDYKLTRRDQDVLASFSDDQVFDDLMQLPLRLFKQYEAAATLTAADRATLTTAFALQIALDMPVFPAAFVRLQISRNVRTYPCADGEKVVLTFYPGDLRQGTNATFELEPDKQAFYRFYLDRVRPPLPVGRPDYLFPGRGGGQQKASSFSQKLARLTQVEIGIAINSTVLRDVVASELYRRSSICDGDVKKMLANKQEASSRRVKHEVERQNSEQLAARHHPIRTELNW